MSQVEIQKKELLGLQEWGMRKFANLDYRVQVIKEMARTSGAEQAVLFDDIAYAVPEAQRPLLHGLPGYERALLPGLITALGFEKGAIVLVGAPPNPVEFRYIKGFKTRLEQELERPINYRVMYEHNRELIDLLEFPEDTYHSLCSYYAENIGHSIPEPTEDNHLNLCEHYAEEIFASFPTLVIPFQTTAIHRDRLNKLAEIIQIEIKLPDIPNLDKAYNNMLLKKHGFVHIPEMMVITSAGKIIDSFDSLQHNSSAEQVPVNRETAEKFARGIIEAVINLHKLGKRSYIKIDSNGVSGLGNLDPSEHEILYNQDASVEEQIVYLTALLLEKLSGSLPTTAVVEEFVETAEIERVRQDYTVCGQLVDGVFLPTSITPFGTTHGVYDREWVGPNAQSLGEDPHLWTKLFDVFKQMGEILAGTGYRNGILAGDIFAAEDGRLLVHDYNFRRGGRSGPEAMMALIPQGWFEAQIEIALPITLENKSLFELYTAICQDLYELGIYPFSTAFGYFGKTNDHNFMKYKLMVPVRAFDLEDGTHIQRSAQLEHIQKLVQLTVQKRLQQ